MAWGARFLKDLNTVESTEIERGEYPSPNQKGGKRRKGVWWRIRHCLRSWGVRKQKAGATLTESLTSAESLTFDRKPHGSPFLPLLRLPRLFLE
jgi:hypothetical protein